MNLMTLITNSLHYFRHAYDMNSVYTVLVNVSDQGIYETSELKIAINERGCIFPQISIEEDAKVRRVVCLLGVNKGKAKMYAFFIRIFSFLKNYTNQVNLFFRRHRPYYVTVFHKSSLSGRL